jgi:hypothetical protein
MIAYPSTAKGGRMKPTKIRTWLEVEVEITADAYKEEIQTFHSPGAPAYCEITGIVFLDGDKELTFDELKDWLLSNNSDSLHEEVLSNVE